MERRELLLRLGTLASRARVNLRPVRPTPPASPPDPPSRQNPLLLFELDGRRIAIPRNGEINDLTGWAILAEAERLVSDGPPPSAGVAGPRTVTATRCGDWWALSVNLPSRDLPSRDLSSRGLSSRGLSSRDVGLDHGGRAIHTQCRRLDQAEEAIREAISQVLATTGNAASVTYLDLAIVAELPEGLVSRRTLEVIDERRANAEAEADTPATVRELRAAGLTVRDVGALLGLTPSRISQISRQTTKQTTRQTARQTDRSRA